MVFLHVVGHDITCLPLVTYSQVVHLGLELRVVGHEPRHLALQLAVVHLVPLTHQDGQLYFLHFLLGLLSRRGTRLVDVAVLEHPVHRVRGAALGCFRSPLRASAQGACVHCTP